MISFQEKELLVERPHGNIVTTLIDEDRFEKPLITSTHYMYGVGEEYKDPNSDFISVLVNLISSSFFSCKSASS